MKRTRRFWTFLAAAFVFWFFANQTQIGWLYIISALLVAVVVAAWLLNRGVLRKVAIQRDLNMTPENNLHEGDDLSIILTMQSQGQLPTSHLSIMETCPLVAPESDKRELSMFIPMLHQAITFEYDIIVHRRGVHDFPTIRLGSRAPFGFFERSSEQAVPTSILVYPELRKLTRLSLLDEQPAAELTNPKAGIGSEVIGVRPYRAGDSPRHIHWRSVARRGQLVSKEFSQETQPGVTVVLDRYCPLSPLPATKHQPFEIAVKSAVSIAEYAIRKGYPVHVAADSDSMAVPQGAIVWDSLMQYTARVSPTTQSNLADVLNYQPLQQFVAIVMTWVDDTVLEAIYALQHRGYNLLVVIPEARSYPIDSDVSAKQFVGALKRHGIETCLIQHGEDWSEVISHGISE